MHIASAYTRGYYWAKFKGEDDWEPVRFNPDADESSQWEYINAGDAKPIDAFQEIGYKIIYECPQKQEI